MTKLFKYTAFVLPLMAVAASAAFAGVTPKMPVEQSPSIIKALFGSKKKVEVKQDSIIKDDAAFASGTRLYDIMLFEQADLEFFINLPKDWQMDSVDNAIGGLPSDQPLNLKTEDQAGNQSQRLMTDTAIFRSPMISTMQAVVTVKSITLDHEIATINWLKNYIVINGNAPDGPVVSNTDTRASASFFYTVENQSFHAYVTAQMSGNHMILARFDVPLNLKEEVSYLQKKTIDSFGMPYPKVGPVEQQSTFSMADAIKFNYPMSWETTGSSLKDLNRLSLRMNNRDTTGTLQGTIQVMAVRRTRSTRLLSETETLKKFFTDLKFKIGDMTVSDKIPASNRFMFNRYEIYTIQKETQNAQELHVALLGDASWYVIVFLVTPKESENLYTWARNTRSFQQLVQSIK